MKNKLLLSIITAACVLFGVGMLWASQSVSVVSDLNGVSANFNVSKGHSAAEEISLSLPAISLNSVALNGQEYKTVGLPDGPHLSQASIGEEGKPDVPVYSSLIAIPDQVGIQLTVSYTAFDIVDNVDLAPVQPAAVEGDPNLVPFSRDADAYSTNAFYPSELATASDPVIMRDIRMAEISYSPVQYNPVTRQLKIYRDLSVSVSYTNENVVNPKNVHHQYISDGFYPIYKALLANADEFLATTDVRRGGYVIITKPMFIDSMKALINWKHRKGYNVRVVPTTEINSGGNPTSTQIYNYLQNAYDTWEVPPEYVMIVGDMDNLASTGVAHYGYSGYTSDHHYTQLEGSDYLPDIFLARMSIDNWSDFRKVYAKIMDYETHPYMNETGYWLRGLSVAGNIQSFTPRIIVLWARKKLLEAGYTSVDTVFDWGGGGGADSITASLNRGVSIVSYRGWAGPSGWYNPSYNVGNLNGVTNNNKAGIMASIVCGTGDFGDGTDPCFGETWLRTGASSSSYHGGPAFYGTTDHSTHTQYNNPNMTGYYAGIFNEGIYHFAAAAVRGKLQLYNTFPRSHGPGSTIELYFNTYNMLGDPEIEVRTKIPEAILVSHPDSLTLGVNHIEVTVTDTLGNPKPDVFVTLTKGYGSTEQVFEVGKTDAAGSVALSYFATTPDTMFVTASGRDLIPYQGFTMIYEASVSVGYDSLSINDDNIGYSSGNGDGLVNPGERIELGLLLKNFGITGTALDVTASLEPIDDGLVTVFDGERYYGDIAPGQMLPPSSPYVVKISPDVQNGDVARLKLSVSDTTGDSWYSVIELPIVSSKLYVSNVTFRDSNSRLDPGDSLEMVVTLTNVGGEAALDVNTTLSTEDDYTTVSLSSASFGDIPRDSSRTNTLFPFVIKADSSIFDGRQVNLTLHVTTASGTAADVPFSVPVGSVSGIDPTGPDVYGYFMYDNTDVGYTEHPTFEWVEINPNRGGVQGTRIPFSPTDDNSKKITLPFDFIYYGIPYQSLIVCTNGFAAFDTNRFDMAGNYWYNFFNWPIPDPGGAHGQISPFWDDLRYSGSSNGGFTWNDTTNHRFIIEWSYFTNVNYTSDTLTFEMIVKDPAYWPTLTGDAEFYFMYNRIANHDASEAYASVGFESYDEQRGVQYTYANAYNPGAATLANSRAIRITTNTGRGGIKGNVNLNNGGNNGDVLVSTGTGQHRHTSTAGDYWIKDIPPGLASVMAQVDGYFPVTIESVTVLINQTLHDINFNMTACPIPQNLRASDSLSDVIQVSWDSVSNPHFVGYNVYRSQWQAGDYQKMNTAPIQSTQFRDTTAVDSTTYWYCVEACFADSSWGSCESFSSNSDAGRIFNPQGIGGETPIPASFFLSQNYPNPFNPTTTISYGIPKDSQVRIEIYNLLGQKVLTLSDGFERAGYKKVVWDGRDGFGKAVTSGVYFYRIDTGDHFQTKKMLLLK